MALELQSAISLNIEDHEEMKLGESLRRLGDALEKI